MEVGLEHNHWNYYNQKVMPKDLEEIGSKCVHAFGVRERFFHFEFFRTEPKGEIIALEANIRPPGGYAMDMFNFASDLDMYKTWAEMLTGQLDLSSFSFCRSHNVIYLSRRPTLPYAHSHEELMERHGEHILMEQPIHAGLSVLGGHLYIYRTKECIEELYEFIDYAWERPDGQPTRQRNRAPLYPRPTSCRKEMHEA